MIAAAAMPAMTLLDDACPPLIPVAILALSAVHSAATGRLLAGFLQATTQINDQSIAQAAKFVATIQRHARQSSP